MKRNRNYNTLWKTCLPAIAALAVCATSGADPFKVAWTRTSASTDLAVGTIRDGRLMDNDFVLAVGASKPSGGTTKGNITILKPNRSLADFVEVVPPGGGSLQFHLVRQRDGFIYAIGQAFPMGSTNGQLYVGKFDANLNLVAERMQPMTTSGGFEEPTDCDFDPNGRLYICGVAQKGARFESFLGFTDILISGITLGYTEVEWTYYNKPQLTVNGIIAILIGMVTDSGPTVRSYQPSGGLIWNFNPSQSGNYLLSDILVSGYVYSATGTSEEISPGVFESWARVSRINLTTGMEEGFYETARVPGNGAVIPRDAAPGPNGKRVNFLIDKGNRASVLSFSDAALINIDTWESAAPGLQSGGLVVDQHSEVFMNILTNNENVTGIKLNSNNDLRFSFGMGQTGILPSTFMQDSIYNPLSGDIVSWRSDHDSMAITLTQQAPVAISDGVYRPRSGVFFRSPAPVTTNDRYAKGATITITQQPLHGTVTIGANGFFNYTSNQGYTGVDSFKYQLTKPGLNTSTATVNLNVKP